MRSSVQKLLWAYVAGCAAAYTWQQGPGWKYPAVALATIALYGIVQAGILRVLEAIAATDKMSEPRKQLKVAANVYRLSPAMQPGREHVATFQLPPEADAAEQFRLVESQIRSELGTGKYKVYYRDNETKREIFQNVVTIQ